MKKTVFYLLLISSIVVSGCKKHKNLQDAKNPIIQKNIQAIEKSKKELKEIAQKSGENLNKAKGISAPNEVENLQNDTKMLANCASDKLNDLRNIVKDINYLTGGTFSTNIQSEKEFETCQSYTDEIMNNLRDINEVFNQRQQLTRIAADTNNHSLSYRCSSIDYNNIDNNIPSNPKIVELPQGVFSLEDMPLQVPILLGTWKQTKGQANADFLPGNYIDNVLIFRSNNTLQIKRTYGRKHKIKISWTVRYLEDVNSQSLTILKDPNHPLEATFNKINLEEYNLSLEPPREYLPIKITTQKISDTIIVLDDKTFEKM